MKNRVSYLGMFLALALVFSYVENLIPFFFGVPGMKLGLTNTVILLVLYTLGTRDAYVISILRVLLAGFLFGNAFSIIYSLAGGLLSLTVMCLLKRTGKLNIITISVCGGIFHNLGQIIVAVCVVENLYLFGYFPFLFIGGGLTGLLIGVIAFEIVKRTGHLFKS
ncbi:MAG: Gx transporter family protein [Lachnospiraceae bacterium]|nr:Gx transporter family protein [Lachnospiraceae bacterium]